MSEKYTSQEQEVSINEEAKEFAGLAAVEGALDANEQADSDYEILALDDPELSYAMRRSYLRNTFRLTEKIQDTKPDYVIYLDKSGRPVSWLERELYDDFIETAAGEDEPHPEPQTLFLNIDREHWREHTGGKEFGSGQVSVDDIDDEVIDSLRSILLEREPGDGEDVAELESMLDSKKVLIVDEVRFTGDTLKIANKLLEAAFPTAEFATHHWMTSPKAADPNAKSTGLPDVPKWYLQNAEWGRGVANRNPDKSRKSKSWRQRIGALFLSTSFDRPDPASLKLRKEFKRLAQEYRKGIYGDVEY